MKKPTAAEHTIKLLEAAEAKLARKLSTDAAYALGEEAFRAGYEKCLRDMVEDPKDWVRAIDAAWADYEPSEAVKGLIDGTGQD
jgi:hypothetical protein